ncbi:MAG: helix-turn-helix domain-containing protein [Oscillospiraceae bacterium]|nr:helix-turn-helix domain-containing protein [Oscillospiraceae bacterium]
MLRHRLRELREFNRLNQADVAALLNITRGAYSMYETSKRQMNHESLCILADFYKITVDYLLGREKREIFLCTEAEKEHLVKLRKLNEHGKKVITTLLEIECSRINLK